MGWIIFLIILGVFAVLGGGFLLDKSIKKEQAEQARKRVEAVAKVDNILEKEIDNLSNDYQFVNKSLREQCKAEIRKEVVDSRSRSGLEFRPSYLNRGPIKIPQLAKIVKRFVDLDKPINEVEVNRSKEPPLLDSTSKYEPSSLNQKKEASEDENQALLTDIISKKPSISSQIKNLENSDKKNITQLEKQKYLPKVEPKTLIKTKEKPWAEKVIEQLQQQSRENWKNKYVILDFETANRARSSICQIGLVVMENNQVVFHCDSLVKPGPKQFEDVNISIHGITLKDVENAPTFPQLWEDIKQYFTEDYIVMAHNAGFDITALKAALIYHHLTLPNLNFVCTMNMFKKLEPNMENYKLKTFANKNNISFNHHNALEDTLTLILILQNQSQSIEFFYWSSISKGYVPKSLTIS